MRAYERLGERPRFEIQEPYNTAATRNFHVFRTTFSYVFDPETPWLPDQIVNELRAQYDRMNAAGEFKTDNIMVSYMVQEKTPGLAEYPYAAATRAAARRAVEGRRTGLHRQNRNNVDWGGLLAQILREDHYDALDGAENTAGNRLSRVVFEFTEYRIPYGRGATQDLGLMPRALVDLPDIGNGLCGQACLAYAISPPSIQKNMRIPARKDLQKAAVAMAEKINVKTSMNITEFDTFTLIHPEYTVVIMGGQTQAMFEQLPTILPQITSGRLRPLGVTGKNRAPALPNVPTIAESGVPGYESTAWFTVATSAKVPGPVVQKLNAGLNTVLSNPEVQAKLKDLGMSAVGGGTDYAAKYFASETEKWTRVIKAGNLKAE